MASLHPSIFVDSPNASIAFSTVGLGSSLHGGLHDGRESHEFGNRMKSVRGQANARSNSPFQCSSYDVTVSNSAVIDSYVYGNVPEFDDAAYAGEDIEANIVIFQSESMQA